MLKQITCPELHVIGQSRINSERKYTASTLTEFTSQRGNKSGRGIDSRSMEEGERVWRTKETATLETAVLQMSVYRIVHVLSQ